MVKKQYGFELPKLPNKRLWHEKLCLRPIFDQLLNKMFIK